MPEVTRGSQMQDEIADVGAKLGGANGVRGGAGGTAGVATMLAEADLVFLFCCQRARCSAQSGDSLP